MTRPPLDKDAALAEIIACKPAGYFDKRMPLLRAHVEALAEHDDWLDQVDDARAAGDIVAMVDLLERARVVFARACDIAVALGLFPAAAGERLVDDLREHAPRLE
jgi:hypothetical protein